VRRGSLYLSLGFYFISFKMGRERKSHSLRQVRCDLFRYQYYSS
jgi:hypothetical protein